MLVIEQKELKAIVKLFHQLSSIVLKESLSENADKSPNDENLSRFIFSKSHFNKTGAKHAAFMPRNAETSVFQVSNISEDEIWDIGVEHVGENMDPSLKARADILSGIVREIGLEIVPETSKHILHANITNWPTEKEDQLELAIDLAQASTLHIKPI